MSSTGYELITADAGGDAATDLGVFNAAVTALGTAARGTLVLDGIFHIETTPGNIAPNISIIGKGATDGIQLGNSAEIIIGQTTNILTGFTNYTCNGTFGPGNYYVDVQDTLYGTLVAGDWLWFRSEDNISGVYPHAVGFNYRPGESHCVDGFDAPSGGYFRVYLRTPFYNTFTTTPVCVRIPQLSQWVGSRYEFNLYTNTANRTTSASNAVRLFAANSANIHITCDNIAPGALQLNRVVNSDIYFSQNRQHGDSYGVVLGHACAGNRIVGNIHARGAGGSGRHCISTGGHETGSLRYGTPHSNIIEGNFSASSIPGFDCHPEGRGNVFQNFIMRVIRDSGTSSCVGADTRARDVTFRNGKFYGRIGPGTGDDSYGVQFKAQDCTVDNCLFDGFSIGAQVHSTGFDNCTFSNNTFRNCRRCAIRIAGGDNHKIIGNTFLEGVSQDASYAAIEMEPSVGDNMQIFGNTMVKDHANAKFIQLDATTNVSTWHFGNNNIYGFGAGDMGTRGDATKITALRSGWRCRNHMDAESGLDGTPYDTDAALQAAVDAAITNSTSPGSISEADVGNAIKSAVLRANR